MARPVLLPVDSAQARRYRRRNLRVAIRQLDRAEMYIGALTALDLDDAVAEGSAEELLELLASLRQYLLDVKRSE